MRNALSSAAALSCFGRRVSEVGNSFLNRSEIRRGAKSFRRIPGNIAQEMLGATVYRIKSPRMGTAGPDIIQKSNRAVGK